MFLLKPHAFFFSSFVHSCAGVKVKCIMIHIQNLIRGVPFVLNNIHSFFFLFYTSLIECFSVLSKPCTKLGMINE